MDYARAASIYARFRSSQLFELKSDLIAAAVRYACIRVDWLLADAEKQRRIGEDRTPAHNAFIVTCDILSRNMTKHGEDGSWRTELGSDRKVIGDFACYLHCILGVSAR